jgi:hypothetical protein
MRNRPARQVDCAGIIGIGAAEAREAAEETVAGIQGALVVTRARRETAVFGRLLARSRRRMDALLRGGVA